jgi:hypothetical protein
MRLGGGQPVSSETEGIWVEWLKMGTNAYAGSIQCNGGPHVIIYLRNALNLHGGPSWGHFVICLNSFKFRRPADLPIEKE